ncbi:MAG: flagellar biosynthetic protein FliO [candidate division Zixibacteria bacterium]|nr:flagellar biosynthetic protein FliO [candidate division Zixibacteria bacterium]
MKKKKTGFLIAMLAAMIMAVLLITKLTGVSSAAYENSGGNTPADTSIIKIMGPNETQVKAVDSESVVISLAKLIGALVVVVGAIYGFLFILKKMMGAKLSANRGSRLIEVLETTYIAQKKSVSLVRFGGRAVLVGVSEGNMTALAELNPEETAQITAESTLEKSNVGFKNILIDAKEKIKAFSARRISISKSSEDVDRPVTVQ